MAKSSKVAALTRGEVALVRAMLASGELNAQQILAYFSRPTRALNPARIHEIKTGKRLPDVAPASTRELQAFRSRWPDHDVVTGLHPDDDELVVKAREAMLNAIQAYNNPRATFRSECFIVQAIIAWTYLMHWHFRAIGLDYRSRRPDGSILCTRHGAERFWQLEECLDRTECPLEAPVKENIRFLVALRHEIEHRMTRRIDDALSAKLQACTLNFNAALKRFVGPRCGIDRETTSAIQLVGIDRERRDMLLRDMDLPANVVAMQETLEASLPDEVTRDERYAWRVILVQKNTNSKGRADQIVEFVRPGSDVEGEIHRVLQKEVEKEKFRPSEVVAEAGRQGFLWFKQHDHTNLVRALDAKDPAKGWGAFVDLQKRDWRWYRPWVDEVLRRCEGHGNGHEPLEA